MARSFTNRRSTLPRSTTSRHNIRSSSKRFGASMKRGSRTRPRRAVSILLRSGERQHPPATVHLRIGAAEHEAEFVEGQLEYRFTMDSLHEGKAELSAWTDGAGAPECAREITIEFLK